MIKSIVEELKVVNMLKPQADGSLTSKVISMKNVNKAWVKVKMNQTEANQCTITLMQATDVAAGTNKVPTNTVKIWANSDTDTSDTMTSATAAKTYQFSATHDYTKQVIFEIDPASYFDVENSYDCFYFTSGGSNVANIIEAEAILLMKYKEDAPPTVITD